MKKTSGGTKRSPAPLLFKPDLVAANRRWEAYWAGELLDRPVVTVSVGRPGYKFQSGSTYHDRAFGDMDAVLDRALHNAAGREYLAESVPQFWLSFGPDEIAVFCGAELEWSQDSKHDTNWSKPFVKDWDGALPLHIHEDLPLWRRMRQFYRRAAERLGGKILLQSLDFHTNMDLLAAVRGPERLCMDLIDHPEAIDRAMNDAARIFEQVWNMGRTEGRMDESGYGFGGYSMEGVAVLACDFSAMIGPDMFHRWVRPVLEKEAVIVKHAIYHWDGPRALVHIDELMAMKDIHTVSFVPDPGESHTKYVDLFKRVQACGKAVQLWGSVDELKAMHRALNPAKTWYCPGVGSKQDAEDFLEWLARNT